MRHQTGDADNATTHADATKRECDPFLEALAAAEFDDEPFTDEERAAAEAGWQDYLNGRSMPWEAFKRDWLDDETPEEDSKS